MHRGSVSASASVSASGSVSVSVSASFSARGPIVVRESRAWDGLVLMAAIKDGLPRYALGSLLAFVALNAFGGGIYGVAGAEGVSTEWLEGTPFRDYLIPSTMLFGALGGSSLVAAIAVFRRASWARPAALVAGGILLIWIGVQVALIGYQSWMQPTFFVIGLLVLILGWLLPSER